MQKLKTKSTEFVLSSKARGVAGRLKAESGATFKRQGAETDASAFTNFSHAYHQSCSF
jgi:hypothetical protein